MSSSLIKLSDYMTPLLSQLMLYLIIYTTGPLFGAMVKAQAVQCENADSSLESTHFMQKKPKVSSLSHPPS